MYYTACTEHFPVLLCTTKFAQNTSHYFLLQSLHKALPTSTLYYTACTEHFAVPLYYKACTKYFPVLCTTQLAQSTSLYYLVLQSLHKAQSTKLAQSTSQYYFVPQSLHRALPSSTLYYKACTKHVPVLCTANLAQSRSTKQPLCQSKKNTILKHFLKGIWKGKSPAPKLRKSADKSLSQPWCCHSNTIYKDQLQKTIVLRITHAAAAASNLDAGKPACLDTHGNRTWQQSCSHYTAICHQGFNKRIELRTHEQPLVAEHRGGTGYARNDRSRNRHTHEVPFIAGCSHFTRKNIRFRTPAFSPTQAPCNSHAAITMRFAAAHADSFSTSPLPLVTILRHHPSSAPFVIISLNHHLRCLLLCDVCYVMYCWMYCCVM